MSLIRRLWIGVALLVILAFAGAFLASTWSARRYLEEQLYVKNMDNATSLALSMSQMPKDLATLELQVAAQFDAGHYSAIRLADPSGKTVVMRTSDASMGDAPRWFYDLVPLRAPAGTAMVQDGWRRFGVLSVESHTGYAYAELWRASLRLLLWFLVVAALAGIAGSLMLRAMARPLRAVVDQAEAIGARRFTTVAEPAVAELRVVVRAMNALSARVKAMVDEESRRVEALRRRAQQDPVTGLLNRESVLNVLGATLAREDAPATAVVVALRLTDLKEVNRDHGREVVDHWLARLGAELQGLAERHAEWTAGRLNGTDLVVFAAAARDAASVARRVVDAANGADPRFGTDSASIRAVAAVQVDAQTAVSRLLARMDRALAAAESSGELVVDLSAGPTDAEPTSLAAWRAGIEAALQAGALRLACFPVLSRDGTTMHLEAPARLKLEGAWLAAGRFVAWVARLGWLARLDACVIDAALASIAAEGVPLAVNLSAEAASDEAFVAALVARLEQAPDLATRLWLEVPEHGALRNAARFRSFCATVRPFGCRIGLEHAGAGLAGIAELYDAGLDYLKIDAAYIRDIETNAGNQVFLRAACTMAHAIGLQVIAEGVCTPAERACLHELGFDGLTGPVIGAAS